MNLLNLYWKIRKIRCVKPVEKIYFRLIKIRMFFNEILVKNQVKRDYISQSEEMKRSIEYFSDKSDIINKNCDLLFDDKSKQVYECLIQFRQSSDYADVPFIKECTWFSQYFDNDFFSYKNGEEVFVDCGAYDGDSIALYKANMKRKNITWKKIIAFEPDEENVKFLSWNCPDVIIKKYGVWNENTVLFFNSGSSVSSKIDVDGCDKNEIKVPVVNLDSCPECNDATFIKMDIEGAEYNALLGAEQLIKNNKPKLAICIYHTDEDMLRIIDLVHEMVPEYKLHVRHHSKNRNETVLYAAL